MLILAGVSINAISGDKGIINEAKKTKKLATMKDLEAGIDVAIVSRELETTNPTMENIIETLIEKGIIIDESQVNKETGDITFGDYVLEGKLADYVVSPGEKYYGDKNIVPTNQKYFSFTVYSKTGTATLTGVKDEYAVKAYQNGEATEYTVVIKDGDTYVKDVVIPYEYADESGKKYMVTIIGTNAFQGLTGDNVTNVEERFTSFVLPNTITRIDAYAFSTCTSLRKINIPNGVTDISTQVFYGCYNLEMIEIPESITTIGNSVFNGCTSLKSAIVKSGSLGSRAFANCKKLTNIKLGNRVTSLSVYVFSGCESLKKIQIPASVISIGEGVFQGCTNFKDIIVDKESTVFSSENGILYNKGKTELIYCPKAKGGEVIIPNSVITIKASAFASCNITGINIPDTVTSIENNAFQETLLTSIVIPKNITRIEKNVFSGCLYLENVDIPETVVCIEDSAFSNCQMLNSIKIPSNLTKIGSNVFWNCVRLNSINIPRSVTDIGSEAFYHWKATQTINCEILESQKPDTWDATWDYYDSATPRKANINWGVSM